MNGQRERRTSAALAAAAMSLCALVALGASAAKPSVAGYQRRELKVGSLPAGVRLVEWKKRKGLPARAWVARVDLKRAEVRLTTRLGLTNDRSATNRVATLDEMAAALAAEGRRPVLGVNGNYFDAKGGAIHLYGPLVSDGRVLVGGGGNLLVEDEDHAFTLGGGNQVGGSVAKAKNGKRILNATGFFMEPTIRYDGGVYKTTDNPTYPRTLVGVGDGVLAFLVADGRQPLWSAGVEDRDAVDMLVAEGCRTVAEGDGGGSAAMWVAGLPKALTPRDANYVNRPSDGRPRKVAEGIFIVDESSKGKEKDK